VVAGCLRGERTEAKGEKDTSTAPVQRIEPPSGEEIEVHTGKVEIESVMPLDDAGPEEPTLDEGGTLDEGER